VPDKRDPLHDHEVDGIRELDNALPRWWLYGFYVTIVIGVAYFINFHVLTTPLVGKSTLAAEYAAEMAGIRPRVAASPVAATGGLKARTDSASLARGDEIFHGVTNACFSCHRPDLGGMIGPNLTDEYWLHGCAPADLVKSVTTGYPEKGMQPFGTTVKLTDDQLLDVVSFVLSKQGSRPVNPKAVDPARDKRCGGARDDDDEDDDDDDAHGEAGKS
jgi:cytochrome c oxidase cbb3-type subunit 3